MSSRLSEVEARIGGMRELGTVVNALRGIAASAAQQARTQLAAVRLHAETVAEAIAAVLPLASDGAAAPASGPRALVLFCAEQGFAGSYSEHVLEAAVGEGPAEWLLIGSRGASLAAERGLAPGWTAALPARTAGIPRLADAVVEALAERLARGDLTAVDVIHNEWTAGAGVAARVRRLFPLPPAAAPSRPPPLVNLAPAELLAGLAAEYLHAELCDCGLRAFAAENQARMDTMAAARRQVDRRLHELDAELRQVRQEEITAEIVELAAGEAAARASDHEGGPGQG